MQALPGKALGNFGRRKENVYKWSIVATDYLLALG